MNKILGSKGEQLLKNEMGVLLSDINEKLASLSPSSFSFFREFIDYIACLEPPVPYAEDDFGQHMLNDKYLNKKMFEFIGKYSIKKDSEEYFTFDSIRHAFISFRAGGIYNLYKNREAECWYPKVNIRDNIGPRNEIISLGKKISIYRGTSKEEYLSGKFSQSWTLSEKIADDFAFKHYDEQEIHKNTVRVILKASIEHSSVYFYDKDDDEKELIIDERTFKKVPPVIIKEGILK